MDLKGPTSDLVTGRNLDWRRNSTLLTLEAEGVAVLKLD